MFFLNVTDLPNKENSRNLSNMRRVSPYPACVFSLYARVVDERSIDAVAAAQIRSEVDGFLRRWGQSPENQIKVKEAKLVVTERQSNCKVAGTQRLVLKIQKALITEIHTHTTKMGKSVKANKSHHTLCY